MKRFLYIFIVTFFAMSCNNIDNANYEITIDEKFNDTTLVSITEESAQNFAIKEGVFSLHEQAIRIVRNGKTEAIVELSEPIIVAQADREVLWGYYQFPGIRIEEGNTIIVKWQMKQDTPLTYLLPHNGLNKMMSKDGGKTWIIPDKEYPERQNPRIRLQNGDILQAEGYQGNVNDYTTFPDKVNKITISDTDYYPYNELPDDLKGVYLSRWDKKTGVFTKIHASLTDPNLLRSTYQNLMSIVFYGTMRSLDDGTIIAGVYPSYYPISGGPFLPKVLLFMNQVMKV